MRRYYRESRSPKRPGRVMRRKSACVGVSAFFAAELNAHRGDFDARRDDFVVEPICETLQFPVDEITQLSMPRHDVDRRSSSLG